MVKQPGPTPRHLVRVVYNKNPSEPNLTVKRILHKTTAFREGAAYKRAEKNIINKVESDRCGGMLRTVRERNGLKVHPIEIELAQPAWKVIQWLKKQGVKK